MDSALRPRDIQARIRAGESVDDVARAAGVPAQNIDAFAAPVIAEREHIAGLALSHPVRRRGETTSNRALRQAVHETLTARGIDDDDVAWDAWKIEGRRWQVRGLLATGSTERTALFVYDLNGRFSVAANEDGRWMMGDEPPSIIAADPPAGDDDLAIVRAIQSVPSVDDRAEEDEIESPRPAPPYAASGTDIDDAFAEGELAEVDGVYDIVPSSRADLDVLYDMLSSFDEDSVRIYSGLVHSRGEDGPVLDADPNEDPTVVLPRLDEAGVQDARDGRAGGSDDRADGSSHHETDAETLDFPQDTGRPARDEGLPVPPAPGVPHRVETAEDEAEVDHSHTPESAPTPEVVTLPADRRPDAEITGGEEAALAEPTAPDPADPEPAAAHVRADEDVETLPIEHPAAEAAAESDPEAAPAEPVVAEPAPEDADPVEADDHLFGPASDAPDESQPDDLEGAPLAGDDHASPEPAASDDHVDPTSEDQDDPDAEKTVTVRPRRRRATQPSLVDDETGPVPSSRPRKGKRASVPSWDEIMFGSPRKQD